MTGKGNEDLGKVNREFFLYTTEQGFAFEKIICSSRTKNVALREAK